MLLDYWPLLEEEPQGSSRSRTAPRLRPLTQRGRSQLFLIATADTLNHRVRNSTTAHLAVAGHHTPRTGVHFHLTTTGRGTVRDATRLLLAVDARSDSPLDLLLLAAAALLEGPE